MRREWLSVAALALLVSIGVFALSGCGDTTLTGGPAEVGDEAALRDFTEDHGFFTEMGPYDDDQLESDGSDTREPIDPLTFWREISERLIIHEFFFHPEEDTCDVTVHKELWGTLNICDQNMIEYEKPMHHQGTRYSIFERNDNFGGDEGDRHRRGRWTLTDISGFVAYSDTLTMEIEWIQVQSASVDTVITDPSLLMAVPDEIMSFAMGEEVTVTVSGPPEDAILFLHTRHNRSPFAYQGDGTFQGTWTVSYPGPHCAAVQVLAHDSIYDSVYPDDSLVWGMPYEVNDEE